MKSYAAVSLSKDFGIGVIIGNLLAVICNKDTRNKKKIITCAILTSIPGIMCISYKHLNIFWDFEIAFIIILEIVWWITYNDNEERCVETE